MAGSESDLGRWKGIALPWSSSVASYLKPKTDEQVIATSLRMILGTQIGERVMLPTFGSPLARMIFEPADSTLMTEIQALVLSSIQRWENRARIVNVQVTYDEYSVRVMVKYVLTTELSEVKETTIILNR